MATWGNVEAQLAPDPAAGPALRSKWKLKPSMTISGLAAEVFSVRFSPDGRRGRGAGSPPPPRGGGRGRV